MSIGPTQGLLRRARDWAGDVEELMALQWELFRVEARAVASGLRSGAVCIVAAAALAAIGLPLAIVAGLVMLANAMEWPVATVLTIAGVALMALSIALAFVGLRFCSVDSWFPRSRSQAVRNLRSVFSQLKSDDAEAALEETYYPD